MSRDALTDFGDRLVRRNLPSFEQWLDEQGHTERADGHSEFYALEDLMLQELQRSGIDKLDPDSLSFMRVWRGLGIAIVELNNAELKAGRSTGEILRTMPRAMGAMAMYTFATVMKDETPWRLLAKMLAGEFATGTKLAADQIEENDTKGRP